MIWDVDQYLILDPPDPGSDFVKDEAYITHLNEKWAQRKMSINASRRRKHAGTQG